LLLVLVVSENAVTADVKINAAIMIIFFMYVFYLLIIFR
jgi:hypothetical protein